jgi:hypothetical protein
MRCHRYTSAALILTIYLLLGWAYATQSPLLSRPDEPFHLAYVEYLKQQSALPTLYYWLVALLTFNAAMDDADQPAA